MESQTAPAPLSLLDLEEALRESSRLNEQIITSAREGIIVYDRNLLYRVWNPFMEQLTGLKAEAVLGRRATEVFPFLDNERMRDSWSQALAGQEPAPLLLEYHIAQTGRSGWTVNMSAPLRNAQGEITGILTIVHDVTRQRRAHQELEESRRLLRAILDHIPDPAWLKDTEGRFLACNEALARFYGRNPRDIVGKTVVEVCPEQGEFLTGIDQQVLATRQPLRMEYSLRDATGRERWFETIKSPIFDEHQRITRVAGIAREITERRLLEAQLRQAQKMDAVGQLAGGIAHDFNNVLAVMRGYAELMLMEAEGLGSEGSESLYQIVAAAERAANLTRQLLVFSRKQAMQLQPVCLNEVLGNLTRMLKRIIGEQINLQCHFQEALPVVEADTGMLEQIIINLVINARDAMPQSGCLWLETRALTLTAAQTRTNSEARPGRFVCLEVRDNGSGIAPEHLPHIFEPFFTTKEPGKGTGLGLATVYGIVKQHRGWIEVASTPKAGAAFSVYLPALAQPQSAAVAAPDPATLRGGRETILLVEDELSVRAVARRVLETYGYQILEASSAPEAIKIWSEQAERIDLVLTDMVMPQGVTGRALAEHLQAQRPGLKVIFMSGYSPDIIGKDSEFLKRPNSNFLCKPCPAATLLQMVRRVLDEP